jgi:predicted phosphodiesterase
MRYGILGDIHGNLTALEGVLARMQTERIDRLMSVGDIVGYGAAPRECIDLVREAGAVVVMGNHDAACVGRIDTAYFNNYARAAVQWTKRELSREDRAWLEALPMTVHLEHCSMAHGTLHKPELFDYIQSPTDADPSLDEMPLPVCFVGHTHVPVALLRLRDDPQRTAYTVEPEIDVAEAWRALINVGSVGQPRDEDPRAAYAVYDTDAGRVWIKRVEYDIEVEARRILRAGLPSMLADRLHLGV